METSQQISERQRTNLSRIESLLKNEENWISNLANVAAILKEDEGIHWVGFYLVNGKVLTLGPFQGPVACSRIAYGKGVCGTAWEEKRALSVGDVEDFPGHIACSTFSKSEVVVPVFNNHEEVVGVLDVDSDRKNHFNESDVLYYSEVAKMLSVD